MKYPLFHLGSQIIPPTSTEGRFSASPIPSRLLVTSQAIDDAVREIGEDGRSNYKQFLFRRIAWRIRQTVVGSLSERARRRALESANYTDLRIRAPKTL